MEYVLAGRYRLAERLGEGGAGTVWRARDDRLGRDVAVKQLRIPQELDETGRRAFVDQAIHEARSAGRLRDPAIVLVHDVVLEQGHPWIIMDLANGRSLDKIVKESGPLPPHIVARIGLQVLSALEAAHAHGILHQDVKPANILLDADGTAMLTDFGVAAPMGGVGGGGSPGYMPPERLNGLPAGPPPTCSRWAPASTPRSRAGRPSTARCRPRWPPPSCCTTRRRRSGRGASWAG
ncbi:serine/threonine-protein kinase [Nonomuraea recticatena]|uniref:serine/threonine-protein kinase n=1 Tax=Nonomuraea recticatena TaxID=46178 RepID=UPI003608C04B